MTDENFYLVVEAEPYMSFCHEWRARFDAARKAAWELAKSYGASGYFPGFDKEFRALTMVDPIPEGWERRKRPAAIRDRLFPAKGKAGDAVRSAIAGLPSFPRQEEVRDLLNHPCMVEYRDGDRWGVACIGSALNPVYLGWIGDTFIIRAPDPAPDIARTKERHPTATITGAWAPPAGLRSISAARYELMLAEHAVQTEERGA